MYLRALVYCIYFLGHYRFSDTQRGHACYSELHLVRFPGHNFNETQWTSCGGRTNSDVIVGLPSWKKYRLKKQTFLA